MPQDMYGAASRIFQDDRDKLDQMLRRVVPQDRAGPVAPVQPSPVADPFGDAEGNLDAGPIGGFLASAASSIPELFGQNPTAAATRFRAANPVTGFVSEVLPMMVPYAGWYRATEAAPLLSGALKGVMAKTGIKETERAILHGFVKESVRFAPLELSRLGIGLATAPEENWGNLFADVGLSTLLAGGFGGIGGFFRKGGTMLDAGGRVLDADVGLKPSFQLRLLDEDAGKLVDTAMTKEQGLEALTREALEDAPFYKVLKGFKGRGVEQLENGNDAVDAALGSMFKIKSGSGISRKLLLEGAETDTKTLNFGELEAIIPSLGAPEITSVKDIAKTFVYPRIVDITSERGAGAFAEILDNSALRAVGDGVWQAREVNDGLWVQMKRIARPVAGDEAVGPSLKGASGVAEGDRYLLVKTDKPQVLAREAGKVAQLNLSQWAKMRPGYVSNSNTLFNRRFNAVQDVMPLNDFRDLTHASRGTRANWVSNMTRKIAEGAGEALGMKGSATAKAMAEGLYDAFKPVMFRATDNPLYGRMFGLLRDGFRLGDEQVNKIIGGQIKLTKGAFSKAELVPGYKGYQPFAKLVHDLSEEEYRQLVRATQTQTQAEELKKLTTDGVLSPKSAEVVEQMMGLNRTVIADDILPDLKEAGMDKLFKPMEEYVAPRIWTGDFKVQVFDEAGRERWLSSGMSGAAAQAEAKAVVAEAATRGKKWTLGNVSHAIESDRDAQEYIEKLVLKNIGSDREAQDIVQGALRRIDAARATSERPIATGLSKSMSMERSGRAGSPDLNIPERGDFIKAVENHYRKLYHYTAYHAWMNRYMGEAFNLEKVDRTLFNDLMRKGRQLLGIPGELTQAQDKALRPILGPLLGSKPATRLAQQANELMFNWNLAIANPTFALVNMLSPIQAVLPMVSYINSVPDEYLAKFFQVVPRFGAEGKPKGVLGFLHPMKILRQSMVSMKNPEPELKRMLEQAKTDGTLSAQLYENWVGAHSRTSQTLAETYKNEGVGRFLWKTATWGAEKSEEFARVVSFNAGYHLGKMRGLEGDQLYAFAKRMNELTNFNYGVVDRSRVFTGPIGSVFGLFKNWQIHYIGMMGEYANVALNQGAFAPLMWQHAGALALAGVGGTALGTLADGLGNWAGEGKDSGYLWMQKQFGPDMGDAMYFGAPWLFGASLQASSAIPGTDVQKELQSFGNVVIWERMKAFGKAAGAAWDYSEVTGENPLRNANIRDQLIAATAPRAVTRLMSSLEGDYVKSMSSGYAQVQGVSPATTLLHAAGLNQLEVERQQVAAREMFNNQEAHRLQIQNLGKALEQAIAGNDSEEQQRIYYLAMAQGLDMGKVIQSARTIGRREEGDLFSRYRKEDVARYSEAMGLAR